MAECSTPGVTDEESQGDQKPEPRRREPEASQALSASHLLRCHAGRALAACVSVIQCVFLGLTSVSKRRVTDSGPLCSEQAPHVPVPMKLGPSPSLGLSFPVFPRLPCMHCHPCPWPYLSFWWPHLPLLLSSLEYLGLLGTPSAGPSLLAWVMHPLGSEGTPAPLWHAEQPRRRGSVIFILLGESCRTLGKEPGTEARDTDSPSRPGGHNFRTSASGRVNQRSKGNVKPPPAPAAGSVRRSHLQQNLVVWFNWLC